MIKVKLFSSFFIPYNNANAYVIGKKMAGLPKEDYDVQVYTYDCGDKYEKDTYLVEQMNRFSIHYITKITNHWFSRIRQSIQYKKNIDHTGDVQVSYFHLSELAYLCYGLKKRDNIPWIAIHSDPPYHMSPFSGRLKRDVLFGFRHFFISTIPTYVTLRYADKLIFNDVWQAKFILGKKYDAYVHKVEIIQMGVDVDDSSTPQRKEHNEKIIIRHLGHVYGPRNAAEFLEGMDVFFDMYPSYKEKVLFEFYGSIHSRKARSIIARMKHKGNFKAFSRVSYQESLRLMKQSDILLVIDGNIENRTSIYPYTPSKIFDYIGAKKPFIAVASKNSPARDITIETQNWWSPFDKEEVAKAIYTCVNEYERHTYDNELLQRYSNEEKTEQFMGVIHKVIRENKAKRLLG